MFLQVNAVQYEMDQNYQHVPDTGVVQGSHFIELTPFIEANYIQSYLDEISYYNHFYDVGDMTWEQQVVSELPEGCTATPARDAAKLILWADSQYPLAQSPDALADWLQDSWI